MQPFNFVKKYWKTEKERTKFIVVLLISSISS